MLTDTHLHLSRREFDPDRPDVLARASAAGVARFLEVGYDLASSRAAVAQARRDPRFRAAVGIHPHDADSLADAQGRLTAGGEELLAGLRELAGRPEVVAIGEIGLDHYRDLSPRPAQRTAFAAQLALARELDLPVVLHIRDAYPEALALLRQEGLPAPGGVMHSFAGDAAVARQGLALGLHLGIGGPVTYRNSRLPAVVAEVPVERLLLETDAPWLPPVPHRGKRNEPAFLAQTAARVADIKGVTVERLARITEQSVEALFRWERADAR